MVAAPRVHLGIREEALDGVRHHVLGGVADHIAGIRVALGHDLERNVLLEGLAEVADTAVDASGNRGLGEAWADLLSDREGRRAMRHRQRLPVG